MKKIVKWLGRVLMVLSIIIMAQKLWEYRGDIEIEFSLPILIQLGLCCLAYAVVVYMCPFIYKRMLYITTGRNLNYATVAQIYCKSNVMKYLPGNVMQYVGRNEIAIQEDIPHGKVALATMLEIVVVVLSTMLVAVLFSWSYTVEWISQFGNINIGILLAAIVVIILLGIIILIIFRNRILDYIIEILNMKNILVFCGMLLYNSLIMFFNSCIYFYVLSLLGIEMDMHYYLAGIGLYALAFVLGYVTPGVPGGIGIRETVLVYFFSSFIQEAQILSGAVVFRVVSVIGDFIGLGISVVVKQIVKSKQE